MVAIDKRFRILRNKNRNKNYFYDKLQSDMWIFQEVNTFEINNFFQWYGLFSWLFSTIIVINELSLRTIANFAESSFTFKNVIISDIFFSFFWIFERNTVIILESPRNIGKLSSPKPFTDKMIS